MLKITLARHAETIWNEQLRYIGRTDLDLSELGLKNAGLLADYFKDIQVDELLSSDMKRAAQTAGAVGATRDLVIKRQLLLNEIDFGHWEGLTHDEITAAYPEIMEAWINDPCNVDIPGGEPWSVFADRVWQGWERILQSHAHDEQSRHILIVTHAGCIKVILGRIMGYGADKWWSIYQDKGALNHIVVDQGTAEIVRINDTDYRNP
jgi:alpha-ribazole phosphatase